MKSCSKGTKGSEVRRSPSRAFAKMSDSFPEIVHWSVSQDPREVTLPNKTGSLFCLQ